MKHLLFLFFLMNCVAQAQTTQAIPNEGYDVFVNRIFTEVEIPETMYNNKETIVRIAVDSIGTAKLIMIKPYNKDFFKAAQNFIAKSKWTAAIENGLPKSSIIQIPLLFEREVVINQDSEATPQIDMSTFYKYFAQKLNAKSYKENTLICNAKFKVHEDGSLELISIQESNDKLFTELKDLFAKAEKWNPAIKNGKPVNSFKDFKLTIKK